MAVMQQDPGVPVGYVVMNETQERRASGLDRLLRLDQAEVVALHHAIATHGVQMARAAGKRVHAWTANTCSRCWRLGWTLWSPTTRCACCRHRQ